ncbi:MAG: hypothetical protein ACE5I1_29240, partial [bacterium]
MDVLETACSSVRYFKIRLHDRTKDPEIQKVIAQFELKQFADFDTLIIYKNKSYLIEIKRWTDPAYYQKGKRQLAEYLKSEG